MLKLVYDKLYLFYSFVFILFVINYFVESVLIEYIVGLLAFPMLILAFLRASKLFAILGIFFTVTGILLYLYARLPFYELPFYMTSNMMLLTFLAVLPLMNSVVRAGRFDRRINELIKANVDDLGKLYIRSSFTTYILTAFVSLSALTISQDILKENMQKISKNLRNAFISSAVVRAFTLSIAWSPIEVMVAIAIAGTGVSFLSFLPWLLLYSLFVLLIDWFFGMYKYKKYPYEPMVERTIKKLNGKKIAVQIIKLLIALSIFLAIVVSFGNYFQLNFLLSVILVVIPFTFGWALLMKRIRSFFAIAWKTWKTSTNNMQNLVVLFLTLGFFSSSLNETPLLQLIQMPFFSVIDYPILLFILMQLTFLLLSMVGVHQLATAAVLLTILQPLYDIINPLSIGIIIATGGVTTAAVGTYTLIVSLTSMNINENPYKITLRNLPYGILCMATGVIIAYLVL